MTQSLSAAEEKAIRLLGDGIQPGIVASAVGLSESRISQLLSDDSISTKVMELRYNNLVKHTERDGKADSLEDKLLKKLEDLIPYMMRPMEIARVYQIVNGAKRRGQSAPEHLTAQQTVVQLILPTQIVNHFTVNSNNQVIHAAGTDLVTVQSAQMENLAKKVRPNVQPQLPAPVGT